MNLSKINKKILQQSYWRCSGVLIARFDWISHVVLLCSRFSLELARHSVWTNNIIKIMSEIRLKLVIKTRDDVNNIVLVSLLLTLNKIHLLFWCFHCWHWGGKYWLENILAQKASCSATIYSKLTIEILEQGVKYV